MTTPIGCMDLPSGPIAFLFTYVKRRRRDFSKLALLVVGAGLCAVAVQYGMKMIVDAMTEGRQTEVWWPLAFFLVLIGIESGLWRLSGWLGCRTIVASCADMRVDLFSHLSHHTMHYIRQHHSGSLGNRITSAAGSSQNVFTTMTWTIVPPCVDFLGAVLVLTTVDVSMSVALIGFVLLVTTVIFRFSAKGQPLHRTYGNQSARVGGELVDTISNIWAVQSFSAHNSERSRLAIELDIEAQAHRRSWMHLEKARVIHDVFLWLMAGSMLAWALASWQQGRITVGDVVLVSALTFRILHGSRDLALGLVGVTQQLGVIAEMLNVVVGGPMTRETLGADRLQPRQGHVELRQVTYRYANGNSLFEHFDLDVPAGQKVGIVGPSGAGKSTLLTLLQRADDVHEGTILIDGQSIARATRESVQNAVSVVPQDISLFRRSVMENIRYGRAEATDEEVFEAARRAHCDEFIRALPAGYETMVGERGTALSGGQRQRIGLARAYLKDAPILLLDEATSALDSQSEALVQEALTELMRDRTVIAVAHRLSTLYRYDRIIVLEHGRIAQDGTLNELLAQPGIFRNLWHLQTAQVQS